MYELNLGFDNQALYRGCEVEEFEPGRFRLKTPLDSALVIIAANMLDMVTAVPQEERDLLVLTGPVPPQIVMTAMEIIRPLFERLRHHDGKKDITTDIPGPPDSHDGDPE